MVNILICDDENSYAQLIKLKTEKAMNDLAIEYIANTIDSLDELNERLANEHIDIVFLDVMIGENNSLEWLRQNTYYDTQFIVMTAFPEEAYNLSETSSCYFLVKPKLIDEQFTKAIKRAINNITKKAPNYKILKFKGNNYTLDLSSIVFVETFNNNIEVNMLNGEKIMLYSTLKAFEKELPQNFLRCHKCYLINMNHIHGYRPYQFVMSNGVKIPIPPKKYILTVEKYKKYFLNL